VIDKIQDEKLRTKVKQFLPELERSVALHGRNLRLQADVKAVGGTSKTDASGPDWLRDIAGKESMKLFDKLTDIDLCDHNIPIKSGVKNDKIDDTWLARLADLPDLRNLDISL